MGYIFLAFFLFLTACQSSYKKDERSADLYMQLGNNQLQKGFPAQALSSLLNAEKLNPNNAAIQNSLGMTYFILKQPNTAILHFRRSITIDHKYTEGRNNLARVLIEVGQYPEAESQLKQVFADLTYPEQALANTNMGLLYIKQKQYKKALPYLEKSLRFNKRVCMPYYLFAKAHAELKNYRTALPAYDSALVLCQKTGFDEAHYNAAWAYYKSGQKNKGIALMNETILLYPDGEYQDEAKEALEAMRLNRLPKVE